MIDCNKSVYFSTKSQYEKLSIIEKIKFKSHLMACKPCNDFNNQNKIITDKINSLVQNEQQTKMREQKKVEIKEEINNNM